MLTCEGVRLPHPDCDLCCRYFSRCVFLNEYKDDPGLAYIRRHYKVPAVVGARVRYRGDLEGGGWDGTIIGSRAAYLIIQLDKDHPGYTARYHPTWKIEYLREFNSMVAIEPGI